MLQYYQFCAIDKCLIPVIAVSPSQHGADIHAIGVEVIDRDAEDYFGIRSNWPKDGVIDALQVIYLTCISHD